MERNTKILLGVGVAGVLAFVIYKLTKKPKDTTTSEVPAPNQNTTPSTTSSTLPIKYGSKGDVVKIIQAKLMVSPKSGNFLKITEGKVKEFQKKHGLKVNGMVDEPTWKVIFGVDYPNVVFPNKIDTIVYHMDLRHENSRSESDSFRRDLSRYPQDLIDAWEKAIREGNTEYYYRGVKRSWILGQNWVLEEK